MNLRFRPSALLLPLPLLLTFCTPVYASSVNETLPDAQTLSRLELQAQEANPASNVSSTLNSSTP